MENRNAVIIKTSIIGIATNVLLAIFKAIVGLLANSIAVVLDAINNLSDAMSSIITIVGTKLAGKSPDKKHPLGRIWTCGIFKCNTYFLHRPLCGYCFFKRID